MSTEIISSKVNSILSKIKELNLPIKIDEIARLQGLKVMPYPLDGTISGVLVIEENGNGIIGFNQNESRVRRRFTIAHELGHYELHKEHSHLFVDREFKQSRLYRSQKSSSDVATKDYETEANSFAAAILMPEDLIRKELENIKIDLGSEQGLKELAKKFDVSSTAMYFRLTNLDLI